MVSVRVCVWLLWTLSFVSIVVLPVDMGDIGVDCGVWVNGGAGGCVNASFVYVSRCVDGVDARVCDGRSVMVLVVVLPGWCEYVCCRHVWYGWWLRCVMH